MPHDRHISRNDFAKWAQSLHDLLVMGNLADAVVTNVDSRTVVVKLTGHQVRLFERIVGIGVDKMHATALIPGSSRLDMDRAGGNLRDHDGETPNGPVPAKPRIVGEAGQGRAG